MYDANAVLQASVTETASANGPAFNLPSGTPLRGLIARVLYSAAEDSAGAETVQFGIQHSPDNVNWYNLAYQMQVPLTLGTSASAGEVFIPFRTNLPYVRLTSTFSGSGTSPTITYSAQLGISEP